MDSKELLLRKAQGARLRQAREGALGPNSTASDGAAFLRVSQTSYLQHENGTRSYIKNWAEQYAAAFGVSPAWLAFGDGQPNRARNIDDTTVNNNFRNPTKGLRLIPITAGEPQAIRMIPIVGVVQAGAWTEVDDFEYVDEHTEYVPFDDARYARATVRALTVQGNSCNKEYLSGTKVFFVPAAEKGVREGNFVVVMAKDTTGKAETTIKQVVINKGVIELWPRSDDPRCQEPIIIKNRDEFAQEGQEIVGVVIGAYQVATEGGMLVDI